ncbi:MAG TPA: DUF1801 domain-containing protein, partial [Acidobacteriota bacterium]|nr:DUF1801 domain-containing protein [Acidobacteriota bacterium]
EAYIEAHEPWCETLKLLRNIMRRSELAETVKWGAPCYTLEGKNVLGLGAYKSYCGIWFFQGALLKDPAKVLVNAQEGKTKALRQWRFQAVQDIDETLVAAYVAEAVENQRGGREIKADRRKPVTIPPELTKALEADVEAAAAFNHLTNGKQREYVEHIAEAKRSETKRKRLEKILPMIREKRGLHDRYRKQDT